MGRRGSARGSWCARRAVQVCVLTSMAWSCVSLLLVSLPSQGCGSSLEASIVLLPRARVEAFAQCTAEHRPAGMTLPSLIVRWP